MDATTLTSASFTLSSPDGSLVPATVAYNSGTNVATLTPSAALAFSTTYTARVDTTVKAADGFALAAPVTWTMTTSAAPPPPGSSLVAAYGFNEGAGTTVADSSGNNNNGTLSNATWATAGKFGKALSFNGTNAFVSIPDSTSLHLTTGMTLEAWVNPATLGAVWRTVILKERPSDLVWGLYANSSSGKPEADLASPADTLLNGVSALPLNAWSHLAATYDGANLRLYVNGTQVSSKAVTGTLTTSTGLLKIGGNAIWGEFFNGMIDEVRIYNRALSATELQADMTTAIGATGPPDTTPPTVSITAPAAGATLSGSTTVTGTAADNVGVVGVQFKVDGQAIGTEDTTAPYSVGWDTTQLINGTHTLTAVARRSVREHDHLGAGVRHALEQRHARSDRHLVGAAELRARRGPHVAAADRQRAHVRRLRSRRRTRRRSWIPTPATSRRSRTDATSSAPATCCSPTAAR